MTAQISERLTVDGEQVALLSNPLSDYFSQGGFDPGFQSTSTALWRGYVGSWEIVADRLYLVGIQGVLKSGESACLESVFPGFPDRVFAHWFTGKLRVPKGKLLKYVHMGYGSSYEQDMFLHLRKGVLVGQEVKTNGEAQPNAPEGYSVAAMLSWPAKKPGDTQ